MLNNKKMIHNEQKIDWDQYEYKGSYNISHLMQKQLLSPKVFKTTSLIHDNCGTHLCVLVERSNTANSFCWAIYNEETGEHTLHLTYETAKAKFLNHCKDLLREQTITTDSPFN